MFPIQDGVAKRYPPIVVWFIIIVNTLVFLHQISLTPIELEIFIRKFALIPAHYFTESSLLSHNFLDYFPFFTYMFLHGGWLHLILNMWTLWIFGPAVEDRIGSLRFILFYILVGIFTSIFHALFNASSNIPALGASGAIAGVIGCYVRMFPFARLVLLVPIFIFPVFIEMYAIIFAVFWFMTQIIPGVFSLLFPGAGGIAWWAHIGGFITGWFLVPFIKRPQRNYRRYFKDEGRYGFFPNGYR
jgi:membrane associated rhomboid family serine protease